MPLNNILKGNNFKITAYWPEWTSCRPSKNHSPGVSSPALCWKRCSPSLSQLGPKTIRSAAATRGWSSPSSSPPRPLLQPRLDSLYLCPDPHWPDRADHVDQGVVLLLQLSNQVLYFGVVQGTAEDALKNMIKEGSLCIFQLRHHIRTFAALNSQNNTLRAGAFLILKNKDSFCAIIITSFWVRSLSSAVYLLLAQVMWQGIYPS